jgi:large subunit ribosomal protein L30
MSAVADPSNAGQPSQARSSHARSRRAQSGEMPSGRALRIHQVRSAIGSKPKHRGTLRALGLGRIGRSVVLPDRAEIRGMVARVSHLVEVEESIPEESR